MKKLVISAVFVSAVLTAPFAQAAQYMDVNNQSSSRFFVEGDVGRGTIKADNFSDSSNSEQVAVGIIGVSGLAARVFFGRLGTVDGDAINARGVAVDYGHAFSPKVAAYVTGGVANTTSDAADASGIGYYLGLGGRYHLISGLSASLEYDHYFAVLKKNGNDSGTLDGLSVGLRFAF